MPCFSIREIKSASVRSWGGLVCPSTISIAVGWNVVSGVYNGITCTTTKKKISLLEYDKNNNISWLTKFGRMPYWQRYLIVPLVERVNFQIVTSNNRQSTCREFLSSNVNFYSHLLALCVLGATRQEVTYDKLVQPFLISLYERKIWKLVQWIHLEKPFKDHSIHQTSNSVKGTTSRTFIYVFLMNGLDWTFMHGVFERWRPPVDYLCIW